MMGRTWVGTFCVLAALVSTAAADSALDKPAFSAQPAELLTAARAAQPAAAGDAPVVILREDREVSFDDRGRSTLRWRLVFVVRSQAGVDDWGTFDASWRPFYQDRPAFRARVIDPAGGVAEVDPSLVTDAAAQSSPNVQSDRRRLNAPLPRLSIGAVVEQELTVTDREPLAAGDVDHAVFGNSVPTMSTVFTYAGPAGKLHHVERKLPAGVHARHDVVRGRERWVYEVAALPASAEPETDVASDEVVVPYVGAATGASWQAVARDYRALIERRIAEGRFELPAELPRTASIETVAAIVAWLHHQVRYTGIELGEASIVPWPPAETVKRGFGDCKDQATLLVALLRQAQIRADVVVLSAGPGPDVDPELPAIAAFDHAIVRAEVDGRTVWIDTTDDLLRPGQLPPGDQGRRALVVANESRGLVATPAASAADNALHGVRSFAVTEDGPAQVTAAMRPGGVFEAEYRAWFRDSPSDANAEQRRNAESAYSGTVARLSTTDPGDLATPFELTLGVNDARRVFASDAQLSIELSPAALLAELPAIARARPAARVHDFAWTRPYVYEIENRITVPPGFTLPPAAPEQRRAIGSATFTERRRVEGQTLIVTLGFDSGKPRLSPAELAALQTALAGLADEHISIKLDQTGYALGHAGKPREAIAEYERLIGLHPGEALHHQQLAALLIRFGAGVAARREARKAVALAPADAQALATLGWVLTHDTLGRGYTYDWDRAGAIAALGQARKLDPRHDGVLTLLAQVLERDSLGRINEAGADLRGAIEALRAVLALGKTDERVAGLAQALAWSGQLEEAETVARGASDNDRCAFWIVTAVAATRGAPAALQAASELRSGDARVNLLASGVSELLLLRRYDVAAQLMPEVTAARQFPPLVVKLLAKLTRRSAHAPADPAAAARELLLAMIDPQYQTAAFWDPGVEQALRSAPVRGSVGLLRAGATMGFVADLVEALPQRISGEAGLWRVAQDSGDRETVLYVMLDRGVAKVLGSPELPAGVGRFVLGALGDARNDARARKLLDWVRGDLDRLQTASARRLKTVWGDGAPTSHDAIALAAAALAVGTDPAHAIPIAERCNSAQPDAGLTCHEILQQAYFATGRWTGAAAEGEAIVGLRPDRTALLAHDRAIALAQAGRFDEANRVIDEALARDPDQRDARLARSWIAAVHGGLAEALHQAQALPQHGQPSSAALNDIAWLGLGEGSDLPGALAAARAAVGASPSAYLIRNTLAAVEAASGDLGAAVADNTKAMAMHAAVVPAASDWFVAGLIDEQLGLVDDAAAAYRRVAPPSTDPESAYVYSQKRLAALKR